MASLPHEHQWESQEGQQKALDLYIHTVQEKPQKNNWKSFNKWLIEEVAVGGCTLTKRRVQPWHAPFPHKLLLPPLTGRGFSGGVAAGLRLNLVFLCEGCPPYPSSQAFPALSPPRGSWELTELLQAPSSPALSARSSAYGSWLPGGERCRFTLTATLRAGETWSHSEKDRSDPVSSWFVLRSTL